MVDQQRRIESWQVHRLREHPRQQEMFPAHPPERFRSFVDDICKYGQRDPVEVGPDGTIFDGHHRVKAARELGWKVVDVVVLHELAAEGEAVQLQYMYSRNSQRRQMSDLDLARAFRCMKSTAGESRSDGSLRDEIATLLGCPKKGRTLERLEKVLDMPPAIQTAFSHGTLKKMVAYELATLSKDIQSKVAQQIEEGEAPAVAAAKYVRFAKSDKNSLNDTPQDLYFVWMDFLKNNLDVLNQERDTIVGSAMDHERAAEILSRTAKLCAYLRKKETEARRVALSGMKSLVSTRLSISPETDS